MAPTSYEQELSRLQKKHDYYARMTTQAQQEMQELKQRVHAQASRKRATSDIDSFLNPAQEEEDARLQQRVHAQASRKRATSDIDRLLLNPAQEEEEEEDARLQRAMDIGSFLNPRDANETATTTLTSDDESSSGVEEEEEAPAARFVPLKPRFISSRSLVSELGAQLNYVRARAERRNAFLDCVIELACGKTQHVPMTITDFATGAWIADGFRQTQGKALTLHPNDSRSTMIAFMGELLTLREKDEDYQNGLLSVYYKTSGQLVSGARTRHWVLNSVKPRRLVDLFLSERKECMRFPPKDRFLNFKAFIANRINTTPGFTATIDPDITLLTWRRAFDDAINALEATLLPF